MCHSSSGVCAGQVRAHTCAQTSFKIRQTQREASVPCSPDGLTPASIFCWFYWGNHRAFFSSPIPLHLWKNSCHLTRCPQNLPPARLWATELVTAPCDKGQDVSSGVAEGVCTDVPMQGMILHSLLLQGCNRSQSASPTSPADTCVKFIILFAALFQDNWDVNVWAVSTARAVRPPRKLRPQNDCKWKAFFFPF